MDIDVNKLFASGDLEGKVISGWKVIKKMAAPDKSKNETGGNFSTCYTVEKDGAIAFMKVLDFCKNYVEGDVVHTISKWHSIDLRAYHV